MHKVQELVRLHRKGVGAREVARLLRISPNTERFWRRRLDAVGLLKGAIDELPDIEELDGVVSARQPPQQVSSVQWPISEARRPSGRHRVRLWRTPMRRGRPEKPCRGTPWA